VIDNHMLCEQFKRRDKNAYSEEAELQDEEERYEDKENAKENG